MAHPQLSSLQPLLTLKVTVLQFRCSIVSTFCQFVIMVRDSGGIVSQVRTTWFLSWKLSIFFLTSPELTFLHCTLHLSSPSFREHSLTFCYGCIAVLGDELLYFAVPRCTVVHCYCPMMYCIEVLTLFGPAYFDVSGIFGLGRVRVPLLFGNDLPRSDLPYTKGFMKFGCPEPSKKCLTFETFVWGIWASS